MPAVDKKKAPYPRETSPPVQTLETPTQAIRSPSESTDRSWGLFHLGARPSTPPGI